MAYFPMFFDLTNKNCLVVGGGTIAVSKVKVLLDFGAIVYVVSDVLCDELKLISNTMPERVCAFERFFEKSDVENKAIVIAATNDKETNHEIAVLCKERKIPVNAVDQKEDCSFIFPSYTKNKDVVVAVSSGGNSPVITQDIRDKIKKSLSPAIGDIANGLGEYREIIKDQVKDLDKRKAIFRRIYAESLEIDQIISKKRVQEIIADEL